MWMGDKRKLNKTIGNGEEGLKPLKLTSEVKDEAQAESR